MAAFASAIILAMIALWIGWESASLFFAPMPIAFGDAIPIATLGLVINLASAWLLYCGLHAHHHTHGHDEHADGHHEHQHRGPEHHCHDDGEVYRGHSGKAHGTKADTNFRAAYVHVAADALIVIAAWSPSLIKSAAAEIDGDRVAYLHLWRLGPGHGGVILSIVAGNPQAPAFCKARLGASPACRL